MKIRHRSLTSIASFVILLLMIPTAPAAHPLMQPLQRAAADEGVTIAATGKREIVVLNSNIHGVSDKDGRPNPKPLVRVKQAIDNQEPQVVALQEICQDQVATLRDWYPSWTFLYVPIGTAGDPSNKCPNAGVQGNVVGSKFPYVAGSSIVEKLPISDSQHACRFHPRTCEQGQWVVCGGFAVPNYASSSFMACSTHLMPGWAAQQPTPGPESRPVQTKFLRNLLLEKIQNGVAVVLAGDFNANPAAAEMDNIYRLASANNFTGPGRFHEADQVSGQQARRGGQATQHGDLTYEVDPPADPPLVNKFDYIFYSMNSVDGTATPSSGVAPLSMNIGRNAYSDHELLTGRAIVTMTR